METIVINLYDNFKRNTLMEIHGEKIKEKLFELIKNDNKVLLNFENIKLCTVGFFV